MTNAYSKFIRFQYGSPADIGIENYDPTVGKMAVHQELLSLTALRNARRNHRDTPEVEAKYCEAMETICLSGENIMLSKRMKKKADEFLMRIGKWELKRDCYEAAFKKFKELAISPDGGLTKNVKRVSFIIGSCYTHGEEDSTHLDSGLGLLFTHAWVEIATTLNGEPYTLVIDPSNGCKQYCSADVFYKTACVVHSQDFTKVIVSNYLKLFVDYKKGKNSGQYRRSDLFNLDTALQVCENKDKEMNYRVYANEIVEVVGKSVLACC
jgi:hypothetical protein